MATLLSKTYVLPVISSSRLTCAGQQYTVDTPEYTDIVTVNSAHITCTCHEGHCEHIQVVILRRKQDAAKNAQRDVYEATFDTSYGDAA